MLIGLSQPPTDCDRPLAIIKSNHQYELYEQLTPAERT